MSDQATVTPPVDVQPNAHVGNTDVSRGENVEPVVEQDLLSKVSQFRKSAPVKQSSQDNPDFFDYKQIEEIKDPVAKEIAIKAYKSMQAGLTQKTQAISEERKKLEAKMQEMQNWSPDRIQRELLNNPQFLQAASQLPQVSSVANPPNSGLTNEEFSALTDREKAELVELKQQVNMLKQTNYQTRMQQEHAQLQQKYADYDPQEVTQLWNDLSTGRIQATNEHLYKVANYERAVKAAYEYGLQQSKQLNQERANGASLNGLEINNSNGLPVREKGERDESFLVKLAKFRLAQRRK